MFRVSICYGLPADPESFDDYYTNFHTPMALQIPGLAGLTTGKCRTLLPGKPPPYYLVASLIFETAEDLETALNSGEMRSAIADLTYFASGGVTVFSQQEIVRPWPVPGAGPPELSRSRPTS
jgi:uncharacterized protein (TIGR02118 family)